MTERNPIIERYHQGLTTFIGLGASRGVANYRLDDKGADEQIRLNNFYGLFPPMARGSRPGFIAFAGPEGRISADRVLALKIPDRIKEIGIMEDAGRTSTLELSLARASMPSIVFASGNTVRDRTDVFMLFCLGTMNPEVALKEIQQRLIEAIAKNN